MQKVDRLGWAAGFSFEAYGLVIGVRTSDAGALEDLRSRLPFGWTPSEEAEVDYVYSILVGRTDERRRLRRYHLIYADAVELGRTMDWAGLLDAFEKDLELFVGERAKGRVFVHAGVVGWRGRAIVLPGRTMAGKSTLVAELVRAGASYYSDEFAILDERGMVQPFQRPLELRSADGSGSGKHTPDDLGDQPVSEPLQVACILLSTYRAGARFQPRLLSPGTACLEVLKHTLSARMQPELVLPVLRAVTGEARTFKTLRGHAADVAPAVLSLMSAEKQ